MTKRWQTPEYRAYKSMSIDNFKSILKYMENHLG